MPKALAIAARTQRQTQYLPLFEPSGAGQNLSGRVERGADAIGREPDLFPRNRGDKIGMAEALSQLGELAAWSRMRT